MRPLRSIIGILQLEGPQTESKTQAPCLRFCIAAGCIILLAVLSPFLTSLVPQVHAAIPSFPTGTSWNPKVPCQPIIVTIEQILGNRTSKFGGATFDGSIFRPGITTTVAGGDAKRWLTNTTSNPFHPPGWVPPGPSCNVTNSNGTISVFVQINGIKRDTKTDEDYSARYDPVNGGQPHVNQSDTTFNIYSPSSSGNCNFVNDTGCMHRIHSEIDHDWKAAGYCGALTTCDNNTLVQQWNPGVSLVDVQGFVYWDPDHVNETAHNFSGWEIHPLTAWRLSNTSGDFGLTAKPKSLTVLPGNSITSNITVNSFNIFSGSVTFSTTVFPLGPTITMSPASVFVPPDGNKSSIMTFAARTSDVGNYTVTVFGNNGTVTRQATVSVAVAGFSVSASPTTLLIASGSSGSSTITVAGVGTFSGTVTLNATQVGCNCVLPSLSRSTVMIKSGGSNTTTLIVNAVAYGDATITVTASSKSPSFSDFTIIKAKVVDFGIIAVPTSLGPLIPGQSSPATVTLTSLNHFNGTVTLTTNPSIGLIATLNSNSLRLNSNTNTTTLTVSANAAGTYTVTVTGSSGSLSHTTQTVTVTVVDFIITATSPISNLGSSANSTITVTASNGFTGTVALSDTPIPSGLTCGTISPTSINIPPSPGIAVLSCTASQTGTFVVTIRGTAGSLSHTANATFTFVDFTIQTSQTLLTANAGSSASATITLTGVNGFTGTVALSVSTSIPPGLICTLTPTSATLTTSTATSLLSCSASISGNYNVTVTGTNGKLSHPTSAITFHVVDFTLTPSKSSFTLTAGSGTALDSVSLTSLNGFTSTISLSVSVSPSGPSGLLSDSTVKLTPAGNSTTLTINPGPFAGNFKLNLTGTNGLLSHSKIITLTVNPASPAIATVIKDSTGGTVTTITVGTTVHDTATVANGSQPGGTVTYTFFNNGACTAPGISTSTVTVTNGVVPDSSSMTPLTPGSYSFNATYTGDANNNRASSSCEPLNVTPKLTPTLTTAIRDSTGAAVTSVPVGTTVHDTASLSGGSTVITGTVTYNVFTNNMCSGPPSTGFPPFPQSVTIGAGSSIPASASLAPAAGLYSFNATYSGDATNNAVTSLCEPLTVSKLTPTLTTAISPASTITVGASVTVQGTLTGGFPSTGVSGSITYAFFGNSACTGTPVSTSTMTIGAGNSVPASSAVTPSSAGFYAFNATYSGDGNNNRVSSTCEPLTVNKAAPTIITTISPSSTIIVGASVTGQASLTGGFPSTGVTGSVTYAFFSNGACIGTPTSTSNVVVGSGNSVPASASVTPASAGSYAFNGTYSGDSNNNRVSSTCAPLTVQKATPSITTAIKNSSGTTVTSITVGASVADQATLTGGFPSTGVTGTISYAFFSNGACTGTPSSTSTVNVGASNAVPGSTSVSPAPSGSFGFNATYSGDSNNNRVSGACESLSVQKATPTITTTISPSSTITVGASVTDQASLTGGYPSTGITGSVVYAFFSNAACAGAPSSTSTVTVGAGNSVPASNSFTPPTVGTYSFNGTYNGDQNNNAVASSCALLTVIPIATATSIACGSPVTVGVATLCTVTVSDVAPGTFTPAGTVTLSSNSTGTFSPASSCSLSGTTTSATCTANYTPNVLNAHNVTAAYPGDSSHRGSTGSVILVPGQHSTNTSISCSSPVLVNQGSTCTATATDSSTTGATTPTGTLTFTETGVTGNFNATACTLRAGTPTTAGCSVTFTPSASGAANIVGAYGGDSTHASSSNSATPARVIVNAAIVVNSISATPSGLDTGQSSTLSATFSGGTPTYTCQWLQKTPGAATYGNLGGSSSCTSPASTSTGALTTVGTWSFELQITDSSGTPVTITSNAVIVIVNSALNAPTISINPVIIDSSQSSTLSTTTSFSGGTSPYNCQWLMKGPSSSTYTSLGASFSCNAGDKPTLSTGSLSTVGTWSFALQVSDSGSPSQVIASNAASVIVNGALTAGAISPGSPTIDSGQSITLMANPSGGTVPYSYQWYSAGGCPIGSLISGATSSTFAASPSSTTTYSYRLTDSSQGSPVASTCAAGDVVTVSPTLVAGAITPANPTVDNGQSITLTSHATGGTPSLSYQWYSEGTCTTSIAGATLSTYSAFPNSAATYSYKVTDSAYSPTSQCSSGDTVAVNPVLVAGAITPAGPVINAGQSITLTANPSGGTTPYNYQWYSDGTCGGPIPSAASSTYSPSPSVTTTYSYKVTDAAYSPVSRCSPGDSVAVNSAIIAGAITPPNPTIDSGQSIALTSHVSGGTPSFSYQWYSDGICGTTIPGATSSTFTGSPTATTSYSYKVTDSAQSPASACSPADTVTVNPSLIAGSITPSSPTIDAGQSITLTSHASGGTPSLSYRWYSDGTCSLAITGATSPTYVTAPSVATTYAYLGMDSAYSPVSQCSPADVITVSPALVAGAITPPAPAINNGQSIILTAHPSGGTAPYSYQWYSAANCQTGSLISGITSSTYSASPTSTTTYSYKATDSSQGSPIASSCSPGDTVTVNGALSAGAISPSAPTIDSGQSITLTANPSSGTAPYSYQWYSGGTCTTAIASAASSAYNASPTVTSTYSVKVTDSASASQCSPGDTVTVNPALVAGAITPSSPTIDTGQSMTLAAGPSGGAAPYNYQWYSAPSCPSGSVLPGESSSTLAASPSSTTTYSYRLTDSSQGGPAASTCSAGDVVTVSPALVAGAITPSGPTIDNGQSISLASAPSGGTTPYSYQWFTGGACATAVPAATSSNYVASPTSTTTYSYRVADSSQGSPSPSPCSPGSVVTVNPALVVGPITPASPTIDSGQSIILTSHATGGTPSLSYQWYSDAACATSIPGANLSTYSASPTSASTYSYKLTDSAYSPTSQCSGGDTVTVNPLLVAGAITPTTPTINSGQSITLTANPSGGTTPYGYQWYSDGTCTNLVPSAISQTFSTLPTVSTTYSYKVTDAAFSPLSKCSPGDTVTVNSAIGAGAITPANPAIDNGQSITLASHVSGGAPPFSYQWYSDGVCGTAISGASSATFTSSPTTTSSYSYKVTDSAQTPVSACSPLDTITVNPALVAGAVTPSAPTIDAGQSITLTSHASGGTPSLSYRWYSDGVCSLPITGATSSAYVTTPSVATSYAYIVTDNAYSPVSQCSSSDTVTVNPALGANAITPLAPTVDNGQSIVLSANPSGGTTPYSYQWYSAANCLTVSLISGVTSSTYSAQPTSTTTYSYKATDSSQGNPMASSCSPGDTVTVNAALSAGPASPNAPAIDTGQSITFSANPSGGTTPYSYQWYADGACASLITGATSSIYPASPTVTSTYSYKVTDTAAFSQCSPGDIVTVNPAIAAGAITPSSPIIDNGQSITLTSAPSGGTTPYSYQWYSTGSCTNLIPGATSQSYTVIPASATAYSYRVTDSAFTPVSRCSPDDIVTVNPALVPGAATPSTPTIDIGQSITLAANPSGGTSPYSFQWYSGTSATCSLDTTTLGTSTAQSVSPTANTYYCYTVVDSAFTHSSRSSAVDLVTVNQALAPGVITPSSPTIDSGQSVILAANPSGGTGPYSYQWYSGTSPNCLSDTAPLGTSSTQTVSSTSSAYYCYRATDSSTGIPAASATSPTDLVTVNPVLAIISLTTTSPIDSGQSTSVTLAWSGGTSPYVVALYTSTSSSSCTGTVKVGQNSGVTGTTTSFTASPTTTTSYCATITDGASSPAMIQTSSLGTVVVNPALSVNAPTATPSVLDSGQQSTVSATFTGGTSPYTCQWLGKAPGATTFTTLGSPSACTSPASTSTGVLTTVGSWSFEIQVSDTGSPSVSVTSNSIIVTINAALTSPVIVANPPTIGAGQLSTISTTTSFSGGTSPETCQWLRKGPLDASFGNFGASFVCIAGDKPTVLTGVLSTSGVWSFELQVRDSGSPSQVVTSATASVNVNGALSAGAIAPGAPAIDAGQAITLTASAAGGVPPYSYQWYSDGTCTTLISSAATSTYTTTLSITSTYSYRVTDSTAGSQCSPADTVTVNPALVASTITPAAPTIDNGQSITFSANPSGGTAPYSYQWFSDSSCTTAVSGAISSTLTVSPGATTTYAYKLGDASQGTLAASPCSPGDTVSVNPALVAGSITPSNLTIDSGQSVTLTSHATGGTPPISYQWYSDGACGAIITGATSPTYITIPTSTSIYSYKAVDIAFSPASRCSAGDTITVVPGLIVGAITPPTPSIDTGQSITLISHPTGGATPYTYQWHSGPSATCASDTTPLGTSATQTDSPTVNTFYCYTVTDASSSVQSSSTDLVSVNPILIAGTVTPSTPAIDNGQSITLTANPSGGTNPYQYRWYSSASPSCPSGTPQATSGSITVSLSSNTYYCYTVTDGSNGNPSVTVTSAAFLVTVNPVLAAGPVAPSSPSIDNGQSITLSANPTGGTTPYRYQWYTGSSPSCALNATPLGTGITLTVSPSSSTYYCYRLTDSSIGTPTSTINSVTDLVIVNPTLSAGPISPSGSAIDKGQLIVLSAHTSGGTVSLSYQWFSDGACTTKISGETSSSYVAAPISTTTYSYSVTDSAYSPVIQCSTPDTISVYPALSAGFITPATPTIDSGQSITLTANPSLGTAVYSYQWYSGPSATCSSDPTKLGTSISQSVGPATNTYYCYTVTDSSSGLPAASATSLTSLVRVNPTLTILSLTALSPIDSGQSTIITLSWSGGTPPYTVILLTSTSSSACTGLIEVSQNSNVVGTTAIFTLSPSTTTSYCASVTDGASSPMATQTASSQNVVVSALLAVNAPSATPLLLDNGQFSTILASFSGGSAPYSCQWLVQAPSASGYTSLGSSSSCNSSLSVSTGALAIVGSWSFELRVTDSSSPSVVVTSAAITIIVNPSIVPPVISASPTTVDTGQSTTLSTTTSFSGGTGAYTCQWLRRGPSDSSFANFGGSFSCSPGDKPTVSTGPMQAAGGWAFELQVTDHGSPSQVVNSTTTLTVVAPPTLSVPGPQTVTAGSRIRFTVNATGVGGCNGVTLTSSSALPVGATFGSTQCFATSASSVFSWTPTDSQAPGDYKVTFTATDAHGALATSQVTIHVNPVSKAAPLPILSYSVFGIVGFLAVVLVALVLKRVQTPRRKP